MPNEAPAKCPFAAASVNDATTAQQQPSKDNSSVITDGDGSNTNSNNSSNGSSNGSSTARPSSPHRALPFQEAIHKCPAFSNASCPFSKVKTQDELQDLLVEIPASHWKQTGSDGFFQSLQHFHKTVVEDERFSEMLEGLSVMAIMAKLAKENDSIRLGVDDDGSSSSMGSADGDVLEAVAKSIDVASKHADKHADRSTHDDEDEVDEADIAAAAQKMAVAFGSNGNTTGPTKSASASSSSSQATPTTTTSASATQRRLSQALQAGTKLSHEQAEQVHFVDNFIHGNIDRELYTQYIWNYYCVYKKLEECCDRHAPSHFPQVHFPHELNRTQSLHEDVDFWVGWKDGAMPPVSQATQDYMDRLDEISATDPFLLLSHAYTRYLGDLSGGKVLARIAKRALKLNDKEGLAFYQFDNVSSFKIFKDKYRAALDGLEFSDDTQVTRLVHEANIAFGLNVRIFEELDVMGGVMGASVRPLRDIHVTADKAVGWDKGKDVDKDDDEDVDKTAATVEDNDHHMNGDPADCPFLRRKSTVPQQQQQQSSAKQGECPWPFLLLHGPAKGMEKWQTWLVIGLVLAYAFNAIMAAE